MSPQMIDDGLNGAIDYLRSDPVRVALVEALKGMLEGTQEYCGRICCPRDSAVIAAFAALRAAGEVLRKGIERALTRARVFDDGSDGADGESARSCVETLSALLAQPSTPWVNPLAAEAARYQEVRRGARFSVIDGKGDELRAETLDSAVDAAIAARKGAEGGKGEGVDGA